MKDNKEDLKVSREVKLLQVKVSDKVYKELEDLRDETGSLTVSEVVRDSIKLYKWSIQMKKKGYTLFSMPDNAEGYKYEVVLPLPAI